MQFSLQKHTSVSRKVTCILRKTSNISCKIFCRKYQQNKVKKYVKQNKFITGNQSDNYTI